MGFVHVEVVLAMEEHVRHTTMYCLIGITQPACQPESRDGEEWHVVPEIPPMQAETNIETPQRLEAVAVSIEACTDSLLSHIVCGKVHRVPPLGTEITV